MSLFQVQYASNVSKGNLFPLENIHNVSSIAMYACVWVSLYLFVMYTLKTRHICVGNNNVFSQYVVSLVHSSIVSVMSVVVLNSSLRQDWIWAYNGFSERMIQLFCSYLLSDFFVELLTEKNLLFLIHHFLVFLVYVYSATRPFAHYASSAFILWECSTFFMSLRRVLLELKLHTSMFFQYVEYMFVLSFVVVRLVIGIPFSYSSLKVFIQYYKQGQIPVVMALFSVFSNLVLHAMNLYWFSIIYQKFMNRWRKQYHS